MRTLYAAALPPLLATALAVAALVLQNGDSAAQGAVTLGADTNVTGNTATTLGAADGCVEVSAGDTFDMDIFVSDVNDLVGWELYLRFDPPIVEVVAADLWQFLASNPRSSLTTLSVALSGGRHFLGAADTRGAPESGSGVLARVTLRANGSGVSSAEIFSSDIDGDGDMDFGPRMTMDGGAAVGDVTGDGVFDGPTQNALIAVGESCEGQNPVVTLPPSDDDTPPSDDDTPPSDDYTPPPDDDLANELVRVFGLEPDEPEDDQQDSAETMASNTDDSEDELPLVVLRQEETPDAASSEDESAGESAPGAPEPGISISPGSSSGGGGFPLWGYGLIAAAMLVTAAGVSIYIATRADSRNWH